MEHRKVNEKSKKISNSLSFWWQSKWLRTGLVSMLYAKWEDPEINIVWGQFQPQNIQYKCFLKVIPDPFKSCNKNMSKSVQVDRKMQKASKSSTFAVLQGKWLFILWEIWHMQMSLFPFFFQDPHKKDDSREFQIHEYTEMPKEYAVTSLKLFNSENNWEVLFACFYKWKGWALKWSLI